MNNRLIDQVILVDEQDNKIGVMEKMEAHKKGLLHRAFSIFIFNSQNELLLHQRADSKYHSGGLWTNTCCSHPGPEETLANATTRRLQEEMGINCEVAPLFSFIYRAELDGGLTEHELDHVFIGSSDNKPYINPAEVKDWKYATMDSIAAEIKANPMLFTAWFKIIFNRVKAHMAEHSTL